MQNLVQKIVDLFGSGMGKEIVVFIISMLPILELRGGLLAASILNLNFIPAYIISILGNCLPIPFVLGYSSSRHWCLDRCWSCCIT